MLNATVVTIVTTVKKIKTAKHMVVRASFGALFVSLLAVLLLAGCGSAGSFASQPSNEKGNSQATGTPTPTERAALDTSSWALNSRTVQGTRFSYRYPAGWSSDLVYCPKAAGEMGSHLPTGCASTDFLVGQKAADVGRIKGAGLTVSGKQAVKSVEAPPDNSKAARIYTLMVYGNDGAPLFGFTTYIGPGTPPADQQAILSLLDGVAATLSVEKQP